MRKQLVISLIFFALLPAALTAQHYLGARVGYGSGNVRFYPPRETGSLWGRYNGGVSWKYYSAEKVTGGIEADLLFIQKGFTRPELGKPDTVYTHMVNSIELPIFWQPHVYVLKRDMRLFLNLGLTFSYNIDASYRLESRRDGVIESGPYNMKLTRDNRWGYGLCGGLGINYVIGRMEIVAEGRYDIGYSDIFKNRNKYETNPLRSPLDNLYFSVGVFWRIGGKGILSPPSKRMAEKISQRQAMRDARRAVPAAVQPDSVKTIQVTDFQTVSQIAETEQTNSQKTKTDGNDTPAQGS